MEYTTEGPVDPEKQDESQQVAQENSVIRLLANAIEMAVGELEEARLLFLSRTEPVDNLDDQLKRVSSFLARTLDNARYEVADLPDPEAVKELVEAVKDYFGPYPGIAYTTTKDERIFCALSNLDKKHD